jgi:hypothetical protein
MVVGRSVGRSGKLLLATASTVFLGSWSRGPNEHIFPSHDSESRATVSRMAIAVCIKPFTNGRVLHRIRLLNDEVGTDNGPFMH